MIFAFTETPMLVEGRRGAEHLPTVLALDLCAAVSMHAFVAAQVRELGVGLMANLTCRAWGQTQNESVCSTHCPTCCTQINITYNKNTV